MGALIPASDWLDFYLLSPRTCTLARVGSSDSSGSRIAGAGGRVWLVSDRDEDLIGAGVNHLRHNLGGTGTETATEVFYKAHVNPWATVQPTLQFISSPSGVYRDSMVAGVRIQIVLWSKPPKGSLRALLCRPVGRCPAPLTGLRLSIDRSLKKSCRRCGGS